jgi:serine phosphatase RsbU (regulator of sigma subunit)/anti-sigma regulatory factor (Ser/Thr protein kinase)
MGMEENVMVLWRQHLEKVWFWRRNRELQAKPKQKLVVPSPSLVASPVIDIAPDDPIIAYFLNVPDAVEVDKLQMVSPAVRNLKEAGVKIVIPLVSQGELVGLLNLGPRRSEQDYSSDDRALLSTLASQASPAIRVAQMVREQQVAALERERVENELRVARLIQQMLLPKELPELAGWQLTAYYQSAREVGGDFYDFLYFEDGRLGLVIGDVTDKGVPAALVMATTRSVLRAIAQQLISPGQVLERVNETLYPDIPARMFVTCLYAVLDPRTGLLQYANAGHDLPYRRSKAGVSELRATGMPLGLMPDMTYEQKEIMLEPGESILFYSDGLVEAHNPAREMFGFPRAMKLVGEHADSSTLIEFLLEQLKSFTGANWEQEDDVTMVTLQRTENLSTITNATDTSKENDPWHMLAELAIPSAPGNERMAMEQVADVVKGLNLPARRQERLKTAVAEAVMNAMEYGNKYQPDVPVGIRVLTSETDLAVRVEDQGGDLAIPDPETPDIEAKLAEIQTPRGWGLFLIKNLVDGMSITSDGMHHTIELIMHLEGR